MGRTHGVYKQHSEKPEIDNSKLVNHKVHNSKSGVVDALEESAKVRIQYDQK